MNNYGKYNEFELLNSLSKDKIESEASFSEIYSRYSQKVFAYCLRVTGDFEEAKDIFQDTFIKFYLSAIEHQAIDTIAGFLIRIARNLCLNIKRNKKIKYSIDDFRLVTNDTPYEHNEVMNLIATALELLEFDYREVFILRQYQGLNYEEISEITGESVASVKNKAFRAKLKLKSILQPYLEDMSK
jgi:RNA polymerase sigma-70 factor (ECF subfamily)